MLKLELKHPLCAVEHEGRLTRGGSQMLSDEKRIAEVGCGVVAAAELLVYLARFHEGREDLFSGAVQQADRMPLALYNGILHKLSRKYIPLIPMFGSNGLTLAGGIGAALRDFKLGCTASWSMSAGQLYPRMEEMLAADIPVILAIGPNFPNMLGKKVLDFYSLRTDGSFEKAASARSHYVIVTGLYDDWIRISSWGRIFYLNRAEYDEYRTKTSSPIVSNILYVRPKHRGFEK